MEYEKENLFEIVQIDLKIENFTILNWRFGRVAGLARLSKCVFQVSRHPKKSGIKKNNVKLIKLKKKIYVRMSLTEPLFCRLGANGSLNPAFKLIARVRNI